MKMKLKKWDIIIIGLLLIISFLPYMLIKELVKDDITKGTYAYITVGGEFYKEIPLTGQVDYKEVVIKTEKGDNIVAIENESIRMAKADCPDHVCEEFSPKSKPGQTIVCLPHEVYIEVRGNVVDSEQQVDSGAY